MIAGALALDAIFGAGNGRVGSAAVATSVATFAQLPTVTVDGYLVSVTAESGLTDVIVRWSASGSVWLLEQATCAYSVHSAVEWGASPGEWYDTGGITVETADGAWVYDTTYDMAWRWADASSQFVPAGVYDGTIAGVVSIVGNDVAPAGWTSTVTNAGGAASITTSGGKLTFSAITSGTGITVARLFVADALIVAASNVYLKALVQVTACTSGTGSGSAFFRVLVVDNTDSYDFGTIDLVGAGDATGRWFDATGAGVYAAQAAINQDIATAETLLEIRKVGTRIEARAGGGASTWQALSGATARSGAGGTVLIDVSASRGGGTATATATLRQLRAMRYR